eukprot:m.235925 g.235925  ORF g.235925 m.235925 type:complete len:497 (-) comp19347_c0_seq11:2367-3857(-)
MASFVRPKATILVHLVLAALIDVCECGVKTVVPYNLEHCTKVTEYAANRGDKRAQYNLGFCLIQAFSAKKNPSESDKSRTSQLLSDSRYWLTRAARQDDIEAQFQLAVLLEKHFLPHIPLSSGEYSAVAQEVLKWYERAARHGHTKAQHNTAVCFAEGTGTHDGTPHHAEALHWFEAAGAGGDPFSAFAAARYWGKGTGVPEANMLNAVMWMEKAADLGHTQAAFNTATFYHRGQFVGKNLSTALRFYHAAADDGHEGAMNNAMLLQQEIGNEGFGESVPASKDGDITDDVCKRGNVFEQSSPPAYNQAAQMYLRAAQSGIACAQYRLALLYLRRHVTQVEGDVGGGSDGRLPRGRARGVTWLRRAAGKGADNGDEYSDSENADKRHSDGPAMNHLGLLLLHGDGLVVKNANKAYDLLARAAYETDHAGSQVQVAALQHEAADVATWYQRGRLLGNGSTPTVASMRELLGRAAAHNHTTALTALARLCGEKGGTWC